MVRSVIFLNIGKMFSNIPVKLLAVNCLLQICVARKAFSVFMLTSLLADGLK